MRSGNAEASPAPDSTVVFVFGMGRSGSSALARVLSLCGGVLPPELVGATEANPLGHWEPRDALGLNEAFLSCHGATWHDPTLRLQGEIDVSAEERVAYISQIDAFLRSLPEAPLLVIKEPRITALSAFWFEAACQLGLSVRIVIPVRHPEEVIGSLATRDQASPELSSALWLKYNLLAERQTRTYPRVFVEYTSLLRDWRAEVSRIGAALSLDLAVRDDAAIDEFLKHDLRRQRHTDRISEVFGSQWVSRTYAELSAAARDEPPHSTTLDEVFESYRACERAFRVALDDFRARLHSSNGHGDDATDRRPHITRLIYAVAGRNSQLLSICLHGQWYRERNPDVFAARQDPYEHWVTYGADEGRLPCDDPLTLLDNLMAARMTGPATPRPQAPESLRK
ncbi:MAG TPA: hypothetical protein VGT07_08320 [Steroidobacteraceae bacterium]|nr:hypothetical protein [Steroidobacteraceae bacterium]